MSVSLQSGTEPDGDEGVDDWLEAAFEDRTYRFDEDDPDPGDDHWYDWIDDDDDVETDPVAGQVERRNVPANFHAFDQAHLAPLQQKINDALEILSGQLASGHTEHYRQLIRFYSKLYRRYSLSNTMLIMMAKPDASAVAGYKKWQQLGRQVRTGAKSAQIWCPVIYKREDDESGDLVRKLVGFRTGYVFSDKDLVDWETNPVPEDRPRLPDNQQDLLAFIRDKVVTSGVTVRDVPMLHRAHGLYRRDTHEILLVEGKDSHNQALILLHEWTHALFHREEADRPQAEKEFEAETTAMVMASILGLEAPPAGDYLLCFGATPEQLAASFGRIHSLVRELSRHLGLTSSSEEESGE